MPAYTRPIRGAVLSRKWTSAHALGRTDYGTAENANGAHLGLGNTIDFRLIGGKLSGKSEARLLAKERIFDGWMSIVSAL